MTGERVEAPGGDGARKGIGRGVVSLTTDFGLADPYVGIMHGVLHSRAPGITVVDLCHGVEPQDVNAAAYFLDHAWGYFPEGSVHVAVVDPGVGSDRRILVARFRGHSFLAPDNGLLGGVLGEGAEVHALDVDRFGLPARSRTFHGRDVFAPTAAALWGGVSPAECGPRVEDWGRGELAPGPETTAPGRVVGRVLLVDRFGNLLTNVTPADLDSGGGETPWAVEIGGLGYPIRGTYGEAKPGEVVALVNSYGGFELARRDGSAADLLGVGVGTEVLFVRDPLP